MDFRIRGDLMAFSDPWLNTVAKPSAVVLVSGTVTQASPLRVRVDGATVDSPAAALNGATYSLSARVVIAIRNPLLPLVQGIEA